MISLQAQIL